MVMSNCAALMQSFARLRLCVTSWEAMVQTQPDSSPLKIRSLCVLSLCTLGAWGSEEASRNRS